jgi:SRSO17 transposase
VSFGAVVTDSGYGIRAPFRQALSALGMLWAVGTVCIQKVYPTDVQIIMPHHQTADLARGLPAVRIKHPGNLLILVVCA